LLQLQFCSRSIAEQDGESVRSVAFFEREQNSTIGAGESAVKTHCFEAIAHVDTDFSSDQENRQITCDMALYTNGYLFHLILLSGRVDWGSRVGGTAQVGRGKNKNSRPTTGGIWNWWRTLS